MVTIEPADNAAPGELCLVYKEGGRCEGSAAGRLKGDELVVTGLSCRGAVMADGLVRALLHAALLRGARTAVCGDSALYEALAAVGFVKMDKGMGLSIREFFDRPCRGGC